MLNWFPKPLLMALVWVLMIRSSTHETFTTLAAKSALFHANNPFPTQDNRIATIAGGNTAKKDLIAQQANAVRPIVHERVLSLIKEFLMYKQEHGTAIEKALYKNMTCPAFIDRLLTKRPLMFMTQADSYLLENGTHGHGSFETIGTDQQQKPLILADYLSYDEMQIAVLLGVSCPTYFINNGARDNQAIPAPAGTFQETGIYVGLVGARFEKPGLMEWQHMIVTPEQNRAENGYGLRADKQPSLLQIWEKFYGEKFPTFEEARDDKTERFIPVLPAIQSLLPLTEKQIKAFTTMYFDTAIYKKRMRMVIEPFLVDAHERGKAQNKKVYCHVVGLGLGVWQKIVAQTPLMLDVYADILTSRNLSYIADIDFSWFAQEYMHHKTLQIAAKNQHIQIHFSQRNPADKLTTEHKDTLLVAMYAWDGNAFPGNEYWAGHLTASGDPAAACCSTIAELQNPSINSNVSAKKLFVINNMIKI